jgi:Ca-activated chloride channel family protein
MLHELLVGSGYMMFGGWWFALLAAPLIIGIMALYIRSFVVTKKLVAIMAAPQHRSLMFQNFSIVRLIARLCCVIGALLFLWVALLRPQYETDKQDMVMQQGRDVVVAIDISRSMLATDDAPSRLECAKRKIETLFKRLASERVALVVFSGSALVQCPLTKDFETFQLFLNALDVGVLSTGGTTALDSALQAALDLFKQSAQQHNRLLVIFTDGEDFSQNLSDIKQQAHAMRMHVCTVGVGTAAGAPIPLYDETGKMIDHQRDDDGSIAISRLDEERLKLLAKDLNGFYVRLDQKSDQDIDKLCRWVQKFEKEEQGVALHAAPAETFMYWSALAFLLLVIVWLL